MKRFRRILHPTDFSRGSAPAFAAAVTVATENRATLILVHALTLVTPFAAGEYMSPQTWEKLEASARAGAQRQLNRLLAKARKAGIRATGLLLIGTPHEQIVRVAKRKRADLLVMGTHGRTGLPRFFLGSVATRVVATAPCPVLTVRSK